MIKGEIAAVGPSGFKGGSGIQTRDIGFGILSGTTAVISDYNPLSELDRIAAVLRRHDRGSTEGAALDYTASLSDNERRRAAIELREADRAFYKFSHRLDDFCAFLALDNIERISAWASHREHPRAVPDQVHDCRRCRGSPDQDAGRALRGASRRGDGPPFRLLAQAGGGGLTGCRGLKEVGVRASPANPPARAAPGPRARRGRRRRR